MSAHTPGPWRVGITGHAVYQVNEPELRVALCSDLEENGGRSVEKANARLIAAAPDLLEALELAVGCLENLPTKYGVPPSFYEAIAKARGGK